MQECKNGLRELHRLEMNSLVVMHKLETEKSEAQFEAALAAKDIAMQCQKDRIQAEERAGALARAPKRARTELQPPHMQPLDPNIAGHSFRKLGIPNFGVKLGVPYFGVLIIIRILLFRVVMAGLR